MKKKTNQQINAREYAANYIKDFNSRILEFGPLNRCLLDRDKYKNYFFADIRSTEDIKKFYTSNQYLEDTEIKVDTDSIIDIDFVVKDSYKETFKDVEKFDYIIVSHVLEHIPNLLNFFMDVQNILTENGELIIIYPDKRYCFDHFRNNTKFSDVYNVFKEKEQNIASQILDFYLNVLNENNPSIFWNAQKKLAFPKKDFTNVKKVYENFLEGKFDDDVHYWPFSDSAFLKFLYDCNISEIFKTDIKEFIPTQPNTQEFLVILTFTNTDEIKKINTLYHEAINYNVNQYYGLKKLKDKISSLRKDIKKKEESINNLKLENLKEKEKLTTFNKEIAKTKNYNEELNKEIESLKINIDNK